MARQLLREQLPAHFHLGVTSDGRVFFINDKDCTTSWLHPVTGLPVLTGLQFNRDLPQGWEQDITNEGRIYYVDHHRHLTTFHHPLNKSPDNDSRSPTSPQGHGSKDKFKRGEVKQRSVKAPSAKRDRNAEVVKRGWLYHWESGGISKQWKRRWCVLAEFALFIYKNDDEAITLTSILLPSYRVSPCSEAEGIKRNFAFKLEHENTKTIYFATDQNSDCQSWLSVLTEAAMMNNGARLQREPNNNNIITPFPPNKAPQWNQDPNMHQHQPRERPSSFAGSGPQRTSQAGHPSTQNIPSYQSYGHLAPSPPLTPQEQSFHPGYHDQLAGQNHRYSSPNLNSVRPNSLSSSFNRSLQPNQTPSRDNSFNTLQPHSTSNVAGHRVQADPHLPSDTPIAIARNGNIINPARNSMTLSSDPHHSQHLNPAVEPERLHRQQQSGYPVTGVAPTDHPRNDQQRDSYSDINEDNNVKQLNRWDQNFPSMDEGHLKHGSYHNLLERQQGHLPYRPATFNTRSKSHENFPRTPDLQDINQQQQQPRQNDHSPNIRNQEPDPRTQQQYSRNQQLDQRNQPLYQRNQQLVPGNQHLDPRTQQLDPRNQQLNASHQQPDQNNSPIQPQARNEHWNPPYATQHSPHPTPRTNTVATSAHPGSPSSSLSSSSHHSSLHHPPRDLHHPPRDLHHPPRDLHHPPRDLHHQSFPGETTPASLSGRRDLQNKQDIALHNNPSYGPDLSRSSTRSQGNKQSPNYPVEFTSQDHPSNRQNDSQQQYQPRPMPRSQLALPIKSDLHSNSQPKNSASFQKQNQINIYANLPDRSQAIQRSPNGSHSSSTSASMPHRPPYPSALRHQFVEDIAQTQTPSTQRDYLTSSQLNLQRMQQPSYFQYPSPRDQQQNSRSWDQVDAPLQKNSAQNSQLQQKPLPSSGSPASKPVPKERRDASNTSQDEFSRTNMMDPEARKLRNAYERVNSLRLAADKAAFVRQEAQIRTVKEDPNMSDREILETNLEKITKKNPLSGPRLRMSISAGDLIGKTHDELVLLLIQLRRNQAGLEKAREVFRSQVDQRRAAEQEYRRQFQHFGKVHDPQLIGQHQMYSEARAHIDEIENKLEIYKPIINLLDNMVTMGSLYGGDNLMLATQYRKHLLRPDQYQPPKKMLEFSRKQQEEKLVQRTEDELKQLSTEEVDLEEKINRLNELDRRLQEQSIHVSNYREDKELMEKALAGIQKQREISRNDPREIARLTQQQRSLEKEISHVTQLLGETSKLLEETTAENSKLEYEVSLLRNKIHGELTRSRSLPSLKSENVRSKLNMQKELARVDGLMQGLNQEGARLSEAMNTIRRSVSGTQLNSTLDKEDKKKGSTYLQTDLDTGQQTDLAKHRGVTSPERADPTFYDLGKNIASVSGEWEVEDADENTKRYFGLLPKEKPKTLTVRDVKRQAENRRDKEKKKDEDDFVNGEEIILQVSNVDTDRSTFIQARIPSETSAQAIPARLWGPVQPVYENLQSIPPVPESSSASSSRRSSLILMAPKPFIPYQDKTVRPFRSEVELRAGEEKQNGVFVLSDGRTSVNSSFDRQYKSVEFLSNGPAGSQTALAGGDDLLVNERSFHNRSQSDISNNQGYIDALKPSHVRDVVEQPMADTDSWVNKGIDPPASAFHIIRPVHFMSTNSSRAYTAQPWTKPSTDVNHNLLDVKKGAKGRYLTISSSAPFQLEKNTLFSSTLHSAAGDLIVGRPIDDVPDIIKSSQTKVDQIDDGTIDREILYLPGKVYIPERYDPEADAEQLTEEEKHKRLEKAEKIKRVLASQSVFSPSQTDISNLDDDLHLRVQQEQRERAHFLDLNQELARQVTLQSKKQAAERRKTWSGDQFAEAKRQYEELMIFPA